MNEKLFEMLVERVDVSSQRSRWIFSLLVFISVSLFIATFNFAFSSVRVFSDDYIIGGYQNLNIVADQGSESLGVKNLNDLRMEVVKKWVDSFRISIGPIGVSISATDAGVIGGGCLFIIVVWFFFAIRRENHLIHNVINLARGRGSVDLQLYVFWGISSSQVFNTLSSNDLPYVNGIPPKKNSVARRAKYIMIFMPVLVMIFYMIADVFSMVALPRLLSGTWEAAYGWRYIPVPNFIGLISEAFFSFMMYYLLKLIHEMQKNSRDRLIGFGRELGIDC